MDYSYAFIINVIFMAFLFGPGLPLLFPLALCCLVSHYVTESLSMAYVYKKPAMYDERIHEHALRVLTIMPAVYCFNAAWVYSNQAVFREDINMERLDDTLFPTPSHKFSDYWYQLAPGSYFLILLTGQLIGNVLFRPGLNLTRFCRKDAFAEIKVEHKQSFYEMLQYSTLKAWLEEEEGFYKLK